MTSRILAAVAAFLLSISTAWAANTDVLDIKPGWSFDTTLTSDYISRGVSQSKSHPAIQGDATYTFGNNWYVTAFASSVNVNGGTSQAEFDYGFGYKQKRDALIYDLGFLMTTYPGTAPHFHGNFGEFHAIINYDLGWGTAVGSLWTSPNNQGHAGFSVYANSGLDVKLPYAFVGSGRIGHTSTRNPEKFGMPDYTDWSLSVAHDLVWGFNLSVGYTGTSTRVCNSGPCGNRVNVTLTAQF